MERYVIDTDTQTITDTFGVITESEAMLEPNFNAGPGQALPIIYSDRGVLTISTALWGHKEKEHTLSVESVISDTASKEELNTQACIIPVSGFYMWKETVNDPLPFYVRIHSRDLLGIAGKIYKENSNLYFRPVTTESNVLLKPLGDIMPYIIEPMNFSSWLTGNAATVLEAGSEDISLLPEMTVVRVPDLVNDPSNNSRDLIQPIPKLRDED